MQPYYLCDFINLLQGYMCISSIYVTAVIRIYVKLYIRKAVYTVKRYYVVTEIRKCVYTATHNYAYTCLRKYVFTVTELCSSNANSNYITKGSL